MTESATVLRERSELQPKAKPNIGVCWGWRHLQGWARQRMNESAFELARSDWCCWARRSLNRGGGMSDLLKASKMACQGFNIDFSNDFLPNIRPKH